MRIRALLFIPALAAAALATGASSASASTLFTSTAHTTRVAVGATGSIASTTTTNLTADPGGLVNQCETLTLNFNVHENTETRTSLTVTSGTIDGCSPNPVTITFLNGPWKATITGTGTVVPPNRAYTTTIDNVQFDVLGQLFSGALATGVTVTQPTVTTSPISLSLAAAGPIIGSGGTAGTIDGNLRMEGTAASWSLT